MTTKNKRGISMQPKKLNLSICFRDRSCVCGIRTSFLVPVNSPSNTAIIMNKILHQVLNNCIYHLNSHRKTQGTKIWKQQTTKIKSQT